MSETQYFVERAKSSRAKCKKCKEPILKDDIKICSTSTGGQYEMTSSFHPACFSLPRKFVSGANQMSAEQFLEDILEDRSTERDIISENRQMLVEAIESKAKGAPSSSKKGGGKADGGTGEDFLSKVRSEYEKVKDELDEGDLDNDLEAAEVKPPKAKKPKKDDKDEQLQRAVRIYAKYHKFKIDQIKDILRWNRQVLTGTKDVLLAKIIDGGLFGRLARCSVCDGGRLKLSPDGATVQCNGTFDEDTNTRLTCSFACKAAEAPRWQPWFTHEPSEEESEEMDRLEAEAKGEGVASGGGGADDADKLSALKSDANALEENWKVTSKDGLRKAAAAMVELLQSHGLDIPHDAAEAKRKVGHVITSNRSLKPVELIDLMIKEFGFAAKKEAKAEKKKAAMASTIGNAANAGVISAMQELAELYAKEDNRNASTSYSKVVEALKGLDYEITEDNALGLGKGKTKVPNIGKSSAEKILEFVQTGTIAKLEEKRANFN